jgi:hypothetical protein
MTIEKIPRYRCQTCNAVIPARWRGEIEHCPSCILAALLLFDYQTLRQRNAWASKARRWKNKQRIEIRLDRPTLVAHGVKAPAKCRKAANKSRFTVKKSHRAHLTVSG